MTVHQVAVETVTIISLSMLLGAIFGYMMGGNNVNR